MKHKTASSHKRILDTSDVHCDLLALVAEATVTPARYPSPPLAHPTQGRISTCHEKQRPSQGAVSLQNPHTQRSHRRLDGFREESFSRIAQHVRKKSSRSLLPHIALSVVDHARIQLGKRISDQTNGSGLKINNLLVHNHHRFPKAISNQENAPNQRGAGCTLPSGRLVGSPSSSLSRSEAEFEQIWGTISEHPRMSKSKRNSGLPHRNEQEECSIDDSSECKKTAIPMPLHKAENATSMGFENKTLEEQHNSAVEEINRRRHKKDVMVSMSFEEYSELDVAAVQQRPNVISPVFKKRRMEKRKRGVKKKETMKERRRPMLFPRASGAQFDQLISSGRIDKHLRTIERKLCQSPLKLRKRKDNYKV